MHEHYNASKKLNFFCNVAFQRMKIFGDNGWLRCSMLTGSSQSILWFVQNTLTMKISATFGHRRDWGHELSHQSFLIIEQQIHRGPLKKRATLFWTITSVFLDGFQHFVYQRKKK